MIDLSGFSQISGDIANSSATDFLRKWSEAKKRYHKTIKKHKFDNSALNDYEINKRIRREYNTPGWTEKRIKMIREN